MSRTLKLRKAGQAAKTGKRFQPSTGRGMRAVSVRARSFDPKSRTFEFVLASETPCRTWRIDRNWDFVEVDEVLPMSAIVSLVRENGWPLLDTHNSWSVRDVLGRITALRVEGTELIGNAFLSDRDDVAGVARDLETGVLCEFSVGFDIHGDETVRERKGDVPLVTVDSWSVREGSLVPLPADSTAMMRTSARSLSNARASGRPGAVRSLLPAANGNRTMTNEELATLTAGFRSAVEAMSTASTALLTGLSSLAEDGGDEDLEAQANAAAEEARAAFLAQRSAAPAPAAPAAPQAPAGRSQEEKNQVAGLRAACKKRGLEAEFDALEASGAPIADLRNVLVAGLRTSKVDVNGVQTPPADEAKGKRGKLNTWDDSAAKPGKAAK